MNAAALIERLKSYGADTDCIETRFLGNEELYKDCFGVFLAEGSFAALEEAVADKNYDAAFQAAHAIKGTSGNLGLLPLYQAVSVLVESLRAHNSENVSEEYACVKEQLEMLEAVYEDKPHAVKAPDQKSEKPERVKKKLDRWVLVPVAALFLVILTVGLLFVNMVKNYKRSIELESANHLIEISHQIKLYIEERIENDWKTAYSVANSVIHSVRDDDDENLFEYILSVRDIWGVSNIVIYTENGVGVNAEGEIIGVDEASEMMYQAKTQGEYYSIVLSTVTYTLPVETELRLGGSKIVAISVVQNIESFLDNMDFTSFDGSAYLYLTQQSGAVISKLSHDDAPDLYNIMSLMEQSEVSSPAGEDGTPAGRERELSLMINSEEPTAFLVSDDVSTKYVVSTPIVTRQNDMRLFYLVPEAVVNETLNSFSTRLIVLSVLVIAVFSAVALLVFLAITRLRKKQFDDALISRERMFDLLVAKTHTAFGLFSVGGDKPLYISPNARSIFGEEDITLEKTRGGYRLRGCSGEPNAAIDSINHEMRAWDAASEFQSGYILKENPDSEAGYFSVQLYPIDEERREFVGIAQDVTQQYKREDAVRNALEMAENANAAKSRFLSNMSHDIRTPMNAIVNMTEFALDSFNDPQKQREYLQTIKDSSAHLLGLINDILDVSRIESGQAVIENKPFDIKKELDNLSDIVRPLCADKGLSFITDFSALKTHGLMGDRVKLSQILMNLLSNAVKFTPKNGTVSFTASEIPSLRENTAAVRFVVKDDGIGIPENQISRIFEPFMRVDDKRTSGVEGTGLGLPICKSYIAAMGGTISCDSEQGQGSVFTVELFFQKSDVAVGLHARRASYGETPFAGKTCLVCEDNSINQTIARTILEKLGFAVETASDGREGVEMFLKSDAEYYDVIYMDIQMPELDGYQATRAIRESGRPEAAEIPIIAMTANAFAQDIERARVAGMNGHVGKPIIISDLVEVTYKALNKRSE